VDEHGLRARASRAPWIAAGEETGGAFALVDEVGGKGAWMPLHLHNREDETLTFVRAA
jgi:hypothetical protein